MSKLDLEALLNAPCESVTDLVCVGHVEEVASRKRIRYRDARTGYDITKLGKKAHRDPYAKLRKMFRGCVTDGENVYWYGDKDNAGSCSKLRKYVLVEDSREEATGRKADLIRGIGNMLFTSVKVFQRGEYLEAILAREHVSTDSDLVDAFFAVCDLARLTCVRSENGVLFRVNKLSGKPKWVAPIICPLVDAAQRKDLERYAYGLHVKNQKPEVPKFDRKNKKVAHKPLGPRDFPRWVSSNTSYTNNPDCDEVVRRDGTRVELNHNYQVFVTWVEYCRLQDIKQRYKVDARTKKRRKSKSKGGGVGGKAFTGQSHSSVFKSVARSCK